MISIVFCLDCFKLLRGKGTLLSIAYGMFNWKDEPSKMGVFARDRDSSIGNFVLNFGFYSLESGSYSSSRQVFSGFLSYLLSFFVSFFWWNQFKRRICPCLLDLHAVRRECDVSQPLSRVKLSLVLMMPLPTLGVQLVLKFDCFLERSSLTK